MSNSAVKIAPFGRWTAQKRAAFYLGRYAAQPMSYPYIADQYGTPMYKQALIVVMLTLAACANSGVVPTGPDSYLIAKSEWGFTSGAVHKARLLQEASDFCKSQAKQVLVTSTTQHDVALGKTPAAEVQFRCVSVPEAGRQQSGTSPK